MEVKFCEKCGAKITSDLNFCESCGAKIEREELNQSNQLQQPGQTYVQPQQNKSQTPKKRKMIVVIVITCLVLIGLIIFCLFYSGVIGSGNDIFVKEKSEEVETSDSGNDDAMGSVLELGQAGYYEGLLIIVDGVSTPAQDDIYDQPEDGMQYVLLNITAQNTSEEELQGPSRKDFNIVIDEKTYYCDMESTYKPSQSDAYGPDTLEPQQQSSFAPLYQVPEGATEFEVQYVPGLSGAVFTYQFSVEEDELTQNQKSTNAVVSNSTQGNAVEAEESAIDNSSQFNATEAPTENDFTWFHDEREGWYYGSNSTGATALDNTEQINGDWKGMQKIYDYDGTVYAYQYFTIKLTSEGSDMTGVIHWQSKTYLDGTTEDISGWEDETMKGGFPANGFYLGSPGYQISAVFYEADNRQYAEGIWTVQSGEEVHVSLVRP